MKQIRDGIYGYIYLSRLELTFINCPEFLRLHHILQQSTVFQTYPNNRGSRFSHSIGAMHIAGQLYRGMVMNTDPKIIRDVLFNALDKMLRGLNWDIELPTPGFLTKDLDHLYRRAGGRRQR